MDEIPQPNERQRMHTARKLLLTAALAGTASFLLNVVILFWSVPHDEAARFIIIVQIAFWTFVGALGAGSVIAVLYRRLYGAKLLFLFIAFGVLALSFIPIYLHVGIIHMFTVPTKPLIVMALVTMHITDALVISGSLLIF